MFPSSILKHFQIQAVIVHSVPPTGIDIDRKKMQMGNGFTDTWKQTGATWQEIEANRSAENQFMVPENEEAIVCYNRKA